MRFVTTLLAILFSTILWADKKVALVIGNADYADATFPRLTTPVNDAKAMEAKLKSLGFVTITHTDCSRQDMLNAINGFAKLAADADVGVFYYSGHGVTINSHLSMVPCEASHNSPTLNESCVSESTIATMLKKSCRLSLLFYDACRDDAAVNSAPAKGFVQAPDPSALAAKKDGRPSGQMSCYATDKNSIATTGYGKLSPFTDVLLQHLSDNDEFRSVWITIQEQVAQRHNQSPQAEGVYKNSFYFATPGTEPAKKEVQQENKAVTNQTPNIQKIVQNLRRTMEKPLQTTAAQQKADSQTNRVRGTVLCADDGGPAMGASVMVKGTNRGVVTDANGNFSIAVSPGEILRVSYIGCKTQEVAPTSGPMTIYLEEDRVKRKRKR